MKQKPDYFEAIRLGAARRWEQLEADPELAGPWHQLFKQVQSPRHVLSELLQNADDAGATEASVRIEDGVFIFQHNGEDFSEEHLKSLCRFGYSNKRALHTIGFRGIGFKSTFSLGDSVELLTPSLGLRFDRKRFTEPRWMGEAVKASGATLVRVRMTDPHRQGELEKNLEDWLKSPVSLLFFRNIRRMQVGEHSVHWGSLGPGPVPSSEWMALHGEATDEVLVVRSAEEEFPGEALEEIKQERMLSAGEDTDFPPCRVEIVMGTKGRLFVVLPTGVETELPFACNAPFVQDPARLKIKDPETSPTNRWLLERAGQLAAAVMLTWLTNDTLSEGERVGAYGVLPDVNRDDGSLEGVCGTTVEEAFAAAIEGQPVLLKGDGTVVRENECFIAPRVIAEIWRTEDVAPLLDTRQRPPLSQHVAAADRKKLLSWRMVEEIGLQEFLVALRTKNFPRPRTWRQLERLWEYVAPKITGYPQQVPAKEVKIHPVQGSEVLFSALEVVRLGEKRVLRSAADLEFLAPYWRVVDSGWLTYLSDGRKSPPTDAEDSAQAAGEAVSAVLKETGLADATDVNRIVAQLADAFFRSGEKSLAEHVRLAHIVANLGGRVPSGFRYCTADGSYSAVESGVVWDKDGVLAPRVPPIWAGQHILHSDYSTAFESSTPAEWRDWALSERSQLQLLPLLAPKEWDRASRTQNEARLAAMGYVGLCSYPYSTRQFYAAQDYSVIDFDYDAALCDFLETLPDDDDLWRTWVRLLFEVPERYWQKKDKVRATQTTTSGFSAAEVGLWHFPAAWLRRLSRRPVLRDSRGKYRKPSDLLRSTPATRPFQDVEPFLDEKLDLPANQPLLDLLGVRAVPSGPDQLIACLRTLATASSPPLSEVDKWYRRLDQLTETCSTETLQGVRQTFRAEKLILSRDGSWVSAAAVFLSPDELNLPGVALVRPSVADLSLWGRIGVADRPTLDLAIAWLRSLPSGRALSTEDSQRVAALLGRHPARLWEACAHWISLAGEWVPVGQLEFALSMQGLVPWKHLFNSVKQRTADLRSVSAGIVSSPPFDHLKALAQQLKERSDQPFQSGGTPEVKRWMRAVGTELSRAEFDKDEETLRVRSLAARLAKTSWIPTQGVTATPYLNGTPAGLPREIDVFWGESVLYVDGSSLAKLAKRVPEELGKAFARTDIQEALAYSFERPDRDIRAYLNENFQLGQKEDEAGDSSGKPVEGPDQEPDADPRDGSDVPVGPEGGDSGEAAEDDGDSTDGQDGSETGDEFDDPDDGADHGGGDKPNRRPQKASLVERFAMQHGFTKTDDGRFIHRDGRSMSRLTEIRSVWECRPRSDGSVRYYWFKDQCLGRGPVEIDADIWGLIVHSRETHSIVLTDAQGKPVEVTGAQIHALREAGKLALFPASYRVVFEERA